MTTTRTAPPATAPAGSARPRALLGASAVAVALAAADTYVVVLAMPDMMAGVGLGIESLQKGTPILSGFLLGYIATLPLIGRLADLVVRSRVLLACLALFVLGSAVTALAVELPVMVGGRVLQGIGGGGLVPATIALVADLWPPGRRGTPLGVVGAVQEIGSVLGPVLGALVLTMADWRAIFWLNAIGGILLALAIRWLSRGDGGQQERRAPAWARRLAPVAAAVTVGLGLLALWAPPRLTQDVTLGEPFVPYAGHTSRLVTQIGLWAVIALVVTVLVSIPLWVPVLRRVDLVGALLLSVALGALVLTFATSDPEKQVIGPTGWTLMPIAAVALVGYLVRHRTAREPLIPRGLLRGRVLPALVASLLVGTALVAIVVDVPLLARLTVTSDQTEAALILVRFLLAVPVGALAGGRLLRRTGAGTLTGAGCLIAAVGLGLMSRWGQGSLETLMADVVLVVTGLGIGLTIAPLNDAALAAVRREQHGVVISLVVVGRMVGMVVGLGLLTAVGLHRFFGKVQSLPNPSGAQVRDAAVVQVQTVLAGAAIAALVAAVVAIALGLRHEDATDDAARSEVAALR